MSRIVLISSFVALLAASAAQNAIGAQSADRSSWAKESLACADLGIDPGSFVFSQCVADLHHSLWAAKNLYPNCLEPEGCDR
jgi:hypothetical protein